MESQGLKLKLYKNKMSYDKHHHVPETQEVLKRSVSTKTSNKWGFMFSVNFRRYVLILLVFLLHDDACHNSFCFCTISISILVTPTIVYAHIITSQVISSVLMVNNVNFTNITIVALTVICMLWFGVFLWYAYNSTMFWSQKQ